MNINLIKNPSQVGNDKIQKEKKKKMKREREEEAEKGDMPTYCYQSGG